MTNDFTANELRAVQTFRIGNEQNPVIIIDDYLSKPGAMVEYASSVAQFKVPKNWYPGLRAEPLPQDYVIETIRTLHKIIGEVFDLPAKGNLDANTYFGLVTVPPGELSMWQRLPHFDTSNARQIALLHYLCDGSHGGTSFFRHRSTGYESIDEVRERPYFDRLNQELATHGPRPARHPSGDDDLFEEAACIDAKFNRMIVYRSRVLHSGNINPASNLSADPQSGRLTANVFLAYR